MKENHIKFCTSGNPWNEPNEQTIGYVQFCKPEIVPTSYAGSLKYKDRRMTTMLEDTGRKLSDQIFMIVIDEWINLIGIKKWKKNNPGRKLPGSNKTARMRKKRKKALEREVLLLKEKLTERKVGWVLLDDYEWDA